MVSVLKFVMPFYATSYAKCKTSDISFLPTAANRSDVNKAIRFNREPIRTGLMEQSPSEEDGEENIKPQQ
jgi:hypothetical protein